MNIPIFPATMETLQSSVDLLKESIVNVKYFGFSEDMTEEYISFSIREGFHHKPGDFIGALRGRNRDFVLGHGEAADKSIAARVLLDGDTWKPGEEPKPREEKNLKPVTRRKRGIKK